MALRPKTSCVAVAWFSVGGGIDCTLHCAENSSPAKFDGQIVFVVDVYCTNEIVQGLVDPFHYGVCLWISSRDDLSG